MAASSFRSLEATNRRETVLLVVVFILLFGALGLGLDIAANDIAIVNGQFVGFPVLTIAALVFAGVQAVHHRRSVAKCVRDWTRPGSFGDLRDAGTRRSDGSGRIAGRDRTRD